MAKARLIDFRGGVNEKISSHMIGDSQGQNAVDTDLASVRLQGRTKLDTANKADGTFYYDTSDPSTSRWVSTESSDGDAYIEFASDFAIWNRDLYVALGEDNDSGNYHTDGLIVRFLDGAGSSSNVAIAAPASASVTIDEAGWDTQLIASIPEQGQSGGDTGIVITSGTTATDFSRINYQEFQAGYSDSGNDEPAAYGGRDIWTRTDGSEFVRAASNGDGNSLAQTNDLMTISGGSISGSPTNVTTTNASLFNVQADGSLNSSRSFVENNNNYKYSTTSILYFEWSSSTLGITGWANTTDNNIYYSSASPVYNAYTNEQVNTVVGSTGYYTNFYVPSFTPVTTGTTTFQDTRSGTDNTIFDLYDGSDNATYYAARSTSSTLSVTANVLYTRSGSGGTTTTKSTTDAWNNGAGAYFWFWTYKFVYALYSATLNSETYIETIDFTSGAQRVTVMYNGTQLYSELVSSSTASSGVQTDGADSVWWILINDGTYLGASRGDASAQFTQTYASGTYRYYNYRLYLADSLLSPTDTFLNVHWNNTSLGPSSTDINFNTTNTGNYLGTTQITLSNNTYSRGSVANTRSNGSSDFGLTRWMRPSGSTISLVTTEIWYAVSQTTIENYTYINKRVSQPAAYTFTNQVSATLYTVTPRTYTLHTNTTPIVDSIPETPAFYYDDARTAIWERLYTATQVRDSDSSFSTNWLAANQSFDNTTNTGYFVRTVINDGNGLPQVSNSELRATPTVTDTVFGTNAEHTPLRLDFSITAPSNTAAVAYRLRRVDDTYDVELGYINESTASFAYSTSTNQITISNLAANTTYRLRYHAYQDSLVQVGSASASKINVNGAEFTTDGSGNHPAITLSTSSGGDTRFLAADFWLRQQILAGNASITGDESYAVIKCFDVLHDTSNNSVTSANSDFIDGFSTAMAGSGVGAGDNTATDAPGYLRFLKESNNFFFGVGTERTAASRYGGTNKKGTFLFVSAYNDPTNWPTTGYVQFDSEITGLASYPGELIVFTENAVYRVTGSRFDQMRKTKLATTEGLPDGNHKTISVVNNYLCWVSQSGICFYNGASVTNLTRGRFDDLSFSTSVNLHAGQYEDSYYVVDNNETGFTVDFSLEGFPVSRVDLKEDVSPLSTDLPVLHYVGSQNRLYTRNGVVEQNATGDRNLFTFKTRAFDGGAFGSLKYVKNITLNGTGSGTVQIYLDGQAVFAGTGQSVSIDRSTGGGTSDHPTRVYLPASRTNIYGLPVADVWSVEIVSWDGQIDWIDTEYEVLSN